MAEKITVLTPYDPWPVSSVTDEDLEALADGGLLWPQTIARILNGSRRTTRRC